MIGVLAVLGLTRPLVWVLFQPGLTTGRMALLMASLVAAGRCEDDAPPATT